MPRFFFDFIDGGSFTDTTGHDLADDRAVRMEAMRALPEIARDAIPQDVDMQTYTVLVSDEHDKPVYSATLIYAGVWLRNGR